MAQEEKEEEEEEEEEEGEEELNRDPISPTGMEKEKEIKEIYT